MAEITRQQRTEMARRARQIHQARRRAGDTPEQIASAIADQLPHLLPLEVWRLAHGWTRAEVIERVRRLYAERGLPAPPVNEQMLCRWEHGARSPSAEYEHMLCRVYDITREQLGYGAYRPDNTEGDEPMRRRTLLTTAGLGMPLPILQALEDALVLPPQPDRPEDTMQVRRRLKHAHRLYSASALPPLIETLPGLLAAAQDTAGRLDTPAAWALAADCYVLAAETLHKVGRRSSAMLTADRAVHSAARSGNMVAEAAAARVMGMTLRASGRHQVAAGLIDRAASRVEATGLRTSAQAWWFMRLLVASGYTAAWVGDQRHAMDRIAEAERVSRLAVLPTDRLRPHLRLFRMNFHDALGDPEAALREGRDLHEGVWETAERAARWHTNIASASWGMGRVEDTVRALRAASALAPDEVRYRPRVRQIADQVVERYPRTAGVRELAAAIGRHRT